MNKLLIIGLTMSALITLSGCSLKPPIEYTLNDSKVFSDASLHVVDNYSEALKRMYLVTQVEPIKDNNLDTFYYGINNHKVSDTATVTSIVSTAAGSINIFQLVTGEFLRNSFRKDLNGWYKTNSLFVVEPVIDGDLVAATNRARARSVDIFTSAYKQVGFTTKILNGRNVRHIALSQPDLLIPITDDGTVPNCNYPSSYQYILEEGRTSYKHIPCFGVRNETTHYIKGNVRDPKFPLGDFIIMKTTLPSHAPLEWFASNNQYDWLYQPSFTFFENGYKETLKPLLDGSFDKEYALGRFDLNPNIKMLKTRKRLYFNESLTQ